MRKSAVSHPEAMEARSVGEIPRGDEWQYEPKWDGFRCLLSRNDSVVTMLSKAGQDLARYFPEVVAAATSLPEQNYVLDGELVVPIGRAFSFDDLLQRIHPAESRVKRLSAETPALFLAFDLLKRGKVELAQMPLTKRGLSSRPFPSIAFRRRNSFDYRPRAQKSPTPSGG